MLKSYRIVSKSAHPWIPCPPETPELVGYEFVFAGNTTQLYLDEFTSRIASWVRINPITITSVSFVNAQDDDIILTGTGLIPDPSKNLAYIRTQLQLCEAPMPENTGPDIYFKLLYPDAEFPTKSHATDAGYDVRARVDTVIPQNKTVLVSTGIGCFIPTGYEFQCRPRSSICKTTLTLQNSPGTIDSDYRGEIMVIFHNHGKDIMIEKGERIAQLVLSKLAEHTVHHLGFVQEYPVEGYADRGGGFGSTGKR